MRISRRGIIYARLDALIDLSFVRELTAPLYAETMGWPSLDPVVFFKCMLVAFFENVVSDRALEFRLADSLVIRKYLGYGLDERTPDESTLRKTRQGMPEEVFRLVFMRVLGACAKRGLVNGRALEMDSTTWTPVRAWIPWCTRSWAVSMRSSC
jgi:transposase